MNKGKVLRIEKLRIGKKIRTVILPGTVMWKLDPFVVPVTQLCRKARFE